MRSLSITTRSITYFCSITLEKFPPLEGRIYKVLLRREKFKRSLLLGFELTIGHFQPTQLKDRDEIFFRSFVSPRGKGRKKKHGRVFREATIFINRYCRIGEKPRERKEGELKR